MTDYGSLKVVDLKELLKERSLPVSGKKADLIQRLEEADAAQTASAEPEPEAVPEGEEDSAGAPNPPSEDAPSAEARVSDPKSNVDEDVTVEVTPTSDHPEHVTVETVATPVLDTPAQDETRDTFPVQNDEPNQDVHAATTASSQIDAPDLKSDRTLDRITIQPDEATTAEKTAGQELPTSLPPSNSSQADHSRRRKRSRTPAPTENDVYKKLKSANGEAKITLPEDIGAESGALPDPQLQPATSIASTDEAATRGVSLLADGDHATEEAMVTRPVDRKTPSLSVENGQPGMDPASHHPTNTLYIKNLKRPLQPGALRTHLANLADPTETDQQAAIADFFIDKLRTHCFTKFRRVDQALRARRGLHNQAWPDERARGKLYVDFVPEQKFDEWVAIEDQSVGPKRYQVVYENIDGKIVPTLTDGSDPVQEAGKREVAAPRSPERKPKAPTHDDRAKGFKTLDDLFRSTKARPQLYFLPVNQQKVDRRLRELAQGRGGGRANGDARYTFQDDNLVDDGPDNGLRLDRPRGFVGGPTKPVRYVERRRPDTRRY